MGEVNPTPQADIKPPEDPTVLKVEPEQGERFYKSAIIHSTNGTTYRIMAKAIPSGKIEIIHYACDLEDDGTPVGKRRIRRILDVAPERFETEVETIQNDVKSAGDGVQGVWVHDLTELQDLTQQSESLESWTKQIAEEILKKSS